MYLFCNVSDQIRMVMLKNLARIYSRTVGNWHMSKWRKHVNFLIHKKINISYWLKMDGCLLSASASWYSSRICDGHESGLVGFGASNSIFVIDVSSHPPQYVGHWPVHNSRTTSVVFCGQSDPLLCCTSGEDGKVRVYDVDTRKLKQEHAKHKVHILSQVWCWIDWLFVIHFMSSNF